MRLALPSAHLVPLLGPRRSSMHKHKKSKRKWKEAPSPTSSIGERVEPSATTTKRTKYGDDGVFGTRASSQVSAKDQDSSPVSRQEDKVDTTQSLPISSDTEKKDCTLQVWLL